ncbi:MAG: hypothetical protein LUC38_03790 [Oscillospiraceae bacterium]|nr:hypothetical protein [Oscillospiraceae bacterium]
MIKMWKRLTCMLLSVLMIMSLLPMGVGAEEETDTNSSVMTSVSVKSDNVGYYSPTNDESITLNGTSYTSGVTTNTDGTITYTNIEQVSFKLPDTYSAGETIYVHVTGTVGNGQIRMFLINSYGGTTSTNYYATATDGSFEYWGEMTVSSDGTASEINFKGDSYGVVITSLTVTSIEIFEGTAAEYTCAINGHTYVNGVCTVCGDEEDHCTDLLDGSATVYSDGGYTFESGSLTPSSSTTWIAIPLDRTYSYGETVTIHITGTTDGALRGYLSTSETNSGRSTDDASFASASGSFDTEVKFTVGIGTNSSINQTEAKYLYIKSTSYNTSISGVTITHLGVVQYDVTVNESVGGTVTADKSGANTGETVTLTVTPKDSYQLSSLTVTDGTGAEVTVTDNTFVMPSSNVTVTATFEDTCENAITLSTDNLRDSSTATAVDGGLNSSKSSFELKLPETVYEGQTVTVHITGYSDDDFRVWLSNSGNTASDQEYITRSDTGEFDLTFELTFKDFDGKNITDAGYIMFKGKDYQTSLVNLTVTHVGITYPEEEVAVPELYGWALTLDGKIGVTYYVDMTGVENADSYVLNVTIGDGENSRSAEITHGDSKTDGAGGTTQYYRYTVYVGVTEINSTITATISYGDNVVEVMDYSVATYCSTAIDYSMDESDLCTALLKYGYYAGVFNSKDTGLSNYADLSSVSVSIDSETYGSTATTGYAKTLVLDDVIYIRVYVNSSDAVYVDGVAYTPESNTEVEGYSYSVDIPVSAQNLYKMYSICDADGDVLTKYSVYSYILNNYQDDETTGLADLCKAIYNYGEAAKNYQGWH